MIRVDNQKYIRRLAGNEYKKNIRSNILMAFAILLTAFLITSILSIGVSYWQAITTRSLLLEGMNYDVRLPEPTSDQIRTAATLPQIEAAGLTVKCAIVDEYQGQSTKMRLFWADEICWEKQCLPAFEFCEGAYPVNENELLLSTQALREIGITEPEVGMPLSLSLSYLSENREKPPGNYTLSGFYRDYSGQSKGYVSEQFYQQSGAKPTDLTQGFLNISLKNSIYTAADIGELGEALGIDDQIIFADYDLFNTFIKMIGSLVLVLLLVLLSGSLFIYNVVYTNVSRNVRSYGQLKTIGMTSRQLRSYVRSQVLVNFFFGITGGLILGNIAANLIVPAMLDAVGADQSPATNHVLNLLINLMAFVFTLITLLISSQKPIKIAGEMTPIMAAGYVSSKYRKKNRRTLNGSKPTHMAFFNIFRDRKKAIVVFLSFLTAMTTFLTVSLVITGNSTKTILNRRYNYDFRVINNQTLENQHAISPEQIEQIHALDGVTEVRRVLSASIYYPYAEGQFDRYFERLAALPIMRGDEKELAQQKSRRFTPPFSGRLVGIDAAGFDEINQNMNGSLNADAFRAGKTAVLESFLEEVSAAEAIGKECTFVYQSGDQEISATVFVADKLTGGSPAYIAGGYSPNIIISDQYFEELVDTPITELVEIEYKEPFNPILDQEIKAIFANTDYISYNSKLDDYEEMKKVEQQTRILGGGLILIIGVLALLNYVNVMAVSLQERSGEFLILGNIGMTVSQIKKMLLYEGIGYALITLILTALIGGPISMMIFKGINRSHTTIILPGLWMLLGVILLLLICMYIPVLLYRLTFFGRKQ